MAKQCGIITTRGPIGNLLFYQMEGQSYVRKKSSLTGKRVKTSPEFKLTMVYANLMARASKIGSFVYKGLPLDFQQHWMYRSFTGEAWQLLKQGKTDEEAKEILWKTYVEIWATKKEDSAMSITDNKACATQSIIQKPSIISSKEKSGQLKRTIVLYSSFPLFHYFTPRNSSSCKNETQFQITRKNETQFHIRSA